MTFSENAHTKYERSMSVSHFELFNVGCWYGLSNRELYWSRTGSHVIPWYEMAHSRLRVCGMLTHFGYPRDLRRTILTLQKAVSAIAMSYSLAFLETRFAQWSLNLVPCSSLVIITPYLVASSGWNSAGNYCFRTIGTARYLPKLRGWGCTKVKACDKCPLYSKTIGFNSEITGWRWVK